MGKMQKRERRGTHYPSFMSHLQGIIQFPSRLKPESSRPESALAAAGRVGWHDAADGTSEGKDWAASDSPRAATVFGHRMLSS
jgi:hypothetical protein